MHPRAVPVSTQDSARPVYLLDHEMIRAMSQLITRSKLSLVETIRMWRGQTTRSPTPNKALSSDHYSWLLHDYEHVNQLISTATKGVEHSFQIGDTLQTSLVLNHKSAKTWSNALVRSIRDGQDKGSYLVVSRDAAAAWKLHYSPFGCVEKSDADPSVEARVIHDLSFPPGSSTNAWSDQGSIPNLVYELVDVIACRIIALRNINPSLEIKLMKGDVKAAYKNLHVHECVSAYFAGSIPEHDAVVIDLALPFGWTGSAAHYEVFGKAISHLVRRESPNTLDPSVPDRVPFFCFDWVDDHILVEYDIDQRLQACDSALRLAMIAVLGPRAINNKKFTEWSTNMIALGLEWDSVAMTVSMPETKFLKALGRIEAMLVASKVTRSQLSKLLGSLRHVCSCIRPAKSFFQRLAALWRRTPRAQPVAVDPDARLDLVWFEHILRHGRIRGVPLDYFYGSPDPAVHLYMDASNSGLCVLNPSRREFIRIQFDSAEQDLIQRHQFSINVREQFSALLAVLCWGQCWRATNQHSLVHVRFWIDNSSAVAWCNNLTSLHPFSQEINRIFGAVEAEWSSGPQQYAEGLRRQMVELQQRSLADASRRQYHSTWQQWMRFSSRIGRSPWLQQHDQVAQSLQLVLFAIERWTSCSTSGGSISSVYSQLSHVKWYHRVHAGFEPVINSGHATALAGMRRLTTTPTPRAPVSPRMLEWIADSIDAENPQQRLFLGAALLGFFFLLRSSEYLAVKGGRHKYALQVRDVEVFDIVGRPAVNIVDATHATISLRGSKTDQQGRGTARRLSRSGHARICPVIGAALLLELAALNNLQPTDALCSFSKTRMLKSEELSKVLKAAAAGVGIDAHRISCHSLRSGGASALLAGGADSTTIQLHGRWKSSAFRRYTHYSDDVGAPLAVMMAGIGNPAQ